MQHNYDLISPTAKAVSLLRAHMDDPFVARIAELCDARGSMEAFFRETIAKKIVEEPERRSIFEALNPVTMVDNLAVYRPWCELRLRSLTAAVLAREPRCFIELASGLSPRGLTLTNNLNRCWYLETDLPDMLRAKRQLVHRAFHHRHLDRIGFRELDAVNGDLFSCAVSFFAAPHPITVLHEGLLPYLSHEEIAKVAENIRRLLAVTGGCWITPDIHIRAGIDRITNIDEEGKLRMELFTSGVGRNMAENAFESYEAAERFMNELGFNVEKHLQVNLVPGFDLGENEKLTESLKGEVVWVMSLA